jgi:hypothetical protein
MTTLHDSTATLRSSDSLRSPPEARSAVADTSCLPVLRVDAIPTEPVPRRWLIEGLWGAAAVGFIGGPPKCCKSYLGLDMALSVATGTPCLGTYTVLEPGPALVYLAEDALSVVRERTETLARHRGLPLAEVNLHVITTPRLRLDQSADRGRLFETARRLRPRMLLLDPLVRLHAVDENSATEVAQLLAGLRELQRGLDLAIVLVHHTRKALPAGMAAGQGLRGSTDLHAFGDSNLYLRRLRGQLLLTMEHRAAAAPEPVGLELVTTQEQTIHLTVTPPVSSFEIPREMDLDQAVLDALERRCVMSRHDLRKDLAVQNERLGRTLVRLEGQGHIQRGPDGWRLSDPSRASGSNDRHPVPCSPP